MNHEVFLSIYPSFEFHPVIDFSYQIVEKQGYYPKELDLLVDKIKNSRNVNERVGAIQKFYEYVDYRKDDLTRLKKRLESNERVNLRQIYVLYNEIYGSLKVRDGTDYVYIGGPLSGGHLILDHYLDQVKPLKYYHFLLFDDNNVGIEVPCIKIEGKYLKPEIGDVILDEMPIDINGIKFDLKRANVYFDAEYDKILAINDFSPIIDSAVSASLLSIDMAMIYFQKYPIKIIDMLSQFTDASKLNLDLLCLRNILNLLGGKIKIEGFGFYEKDREFAFTGDILLENLKYLLLSESDIKSNLSFIESLRDEDFKDQITYFSDLDNKSVSSLRGEILEEMGYKIGFEALQNAFEKKSSVRSLPIAFFEFSLSSLGQIIYTSTFDEKELPKEFIGLLQSFVEPLFVIKTGPIESLNYNPDIIEMHLKIGSEQKNFSFVLSVKFLDDIPQTYMGILFLKTDDVGDDVFKEFYNLRNHDLPYWYFENLSHDLGRKLYFEILPNVLSQAKSINLSDPFMKVISQRRTPIVSFIENNYSDILENNILQEILLEAENFEMSGNLSADLYSLDVQDEAMVDDRYNAIMRSKAIKNREERERMQLERLKQEINLYNTGFFEFLESNLNWEIDEFNVATTTNMQLRNIFDDIRIALIDFGLAASQWVYADDVQLWSSYQSQLSWLKHSFTIKIRTVFPNFDGQGIDELCRYRHARNMNYTIFTGKINGAEYTAVKKAYMYFVPKMDKHQKKLIGCRSIEELIRNIETEEEISKSRIKASVPSLPSTKYEI